MRTLDLTQADRQILDPSRLAALTRHLHARLLDFGPDGPEVLNWDQTSGVIQVTFPGHDIQSVSAQLKACGVQITPNPDYALLYLDETIPFEHLDYLWGCLFDILA